MTRAHIKSIIRKFWAATFRGWTMLLLTFFVTSLGISIGCLSMEKETTEWDEVFIVYSSGGGRDVFRDGDRYGHKLEMCFDGDYVLFRLRYRGEPGDSSIEEEEIKRGVIDNKIFQSLKKSILESDFFELPAELPDVSPHEVEYRTPARTIKMSVRPAPTDEMHTVRSRMAIDRKRYPKTFWDLHKKLSEISRDLLELYHSDKN